MDINKYVEKAVRFCISRTPWHVADDLECNIHFQDLGDEVLGFCLVQGSAKVICLNSKLSPAKQEFVLAHELGHIMMHAHIKMSTFRIGSLYSTDKMEREANTFAALLLFGHREMFTLDELAFEYEIELDILKDLLGGRLGQKAFWEYQHDGEN